MVYNSTTKYYAAIKGMKYWHMLQPEWTLETYAKWKKQVIKYHTMHYFLYKMSVMNKSRDRK